MKAKSSAILSFVATIALLTSLQSLFSSPSKGVMAQVFDNNATLEEQFGTVENYTIAEATGLCYECVRASNVTVYLVNQPVCLFEFEGEIYNIAETIDKNICFNDDPRFYDIDCYSRIANTTFECPGVCQSELKYTSRDNTIREGEEEWIPADSRCHYRLEYRNTTATGIDPVKLILNDENLKYMDFYLADSVISQYNPKTRPTRHDIDERFGFDVTQNLPNGHYLLVINRAPVPMKLELSGEKYVPPPRPKPVVKPEPVDPVDPEDEEGSTEEEGSSNTVTSVDPADFKNWVMPQNLNEDLNWINYVIYGAVAFISFVIVACLISIQCRNRCDKKKLRVQNDRREKERQVTGDSDLDEKPLPVVQQVVVNELPSEQLVEPDQKELSFSPVRGARSVAREQIVTPIGNPMISGVIELDHSATAAKDKEQLQTGLNEVFVEGPNQVFVEPDIYEEEKVEAEKFEDFEDHQAEMEQNVKAEEALPEVQEEEEGLPPLAGESIMQAFEEVDEGRRSSVGEGRRSTLGGQPIDLEDAHEFVMMDSANVGAELGVDQSEDPQKPPLFYPDKHPNETPNDSSLAQDILSARVML